LFYKAALAVLSPILEKEGDHLEMLAEPDVKTWPMEKPKKKIDLFQSA
jgi:hypothetical protein